MAPFRNGGPSEWRPLGMVGPTAYANASRGFVSDSWVFFLYLLGRGGACPFLGLPLLTINDPNLSLVGPIQ